MLHWLKKQCIGYVSIDSIAGPSEILVLADETANPRYVAADLLSQAEHDEMASAIFVTTSHGTGREGIRGGGRLCSRAFQKGDHPEIPGSVMDIFW